MINFGHLLKLCFSKIYWRHYLMWKRVDYFFFLFNLLRLSVMALHFGVSLSSLSHRNEIKDPYDARHAACLTGVGFWGAELRSSSQWSGCVIRWRGHWYGWQGFIYTENAFYKALLIACSFSKPKTFWKEVVAIIKNKPSIIDLKGIFRIKWRITHN